MCVWVFAKSKTAAPYRKRKGEVLFIDGRKLGTLVDRVHRELSDEDIARIARACHAWRGEKGAGTYEDVAGFCKSAKLDEIASHGFVLTPGRYVGAEEAETDGEPFDAKMRRLTATLAEQFAEGARLEKEIRKNLASLGYGPLGKRPPPPRASRVGARGRRRPSRSRRRALASLRTTRRR